MCVCVTCMFTRVVRNTRTSVCSTLTFSPSLSNICFEKGSLSEPKTLRFALWQMNSRCACPDLPSTDNRVLPCLFLLNVCWRSQLRFPCYCIISQFHNGNFKLIIGRDSMMAPVITDNTIKNVNDISNKAHHILLRE